MVGDKLHLHLHPDGKQQPREVARRVCVWLIFLAGLVSTGPLALWQVPLFANALARLAPAGDGMGWQSSPIQPRQDGSSPGTGTRGAMDMDLHIFTRRASACLHRRGSGRAGGKSRCFY